MEKRPMEPQELETEDLEQVAGGDYISKDDYDFTDFHSVSLGPTTYTDVEYRFVTGKKCFTCNTRSKVEIYRRANDSYVHTVCMRCGHWD